MSTLKSSAENLTLNADGSGNDIKFQSNGVEKASIDQDGLVTCAGSTMSGALTVNSGANLAFKVNGTTYTQLWQILQSVNDLTLKTTADKFISFQPNSVEKVRIHSSGVMSVPDGIELGSALDATAANTLDDYEEGTWTPTLPNGGTVGTITNTYYTKIGRQVHAVCFFAMSSIPSDGLEFRIGGLPFATPTSHYGPGSIAYMGAFDGLGIGMTNGFVAHDNSYIYFKRFDGTSVSVLNSSVTSLATIIIGVTYCTAT